MFARMTPAQCRMARVALQWTTADLAKAADVGNSTVSRFETGDAKPIKHTLAAMQRALEEGGVVFMGPGEMKEGGEGVRLRTMVG